MLPGQDKAQKAHAARLKAGESLKTSLALFYEEAYQVGQGQLAAAMRAARNRCPLCGSQSATVPGETFLECCNGLGAHFPECQAAKSGQKPQKEAGKG